VKAGDLVGIQWKEGIGYVGSKTGEYLGLVLEPDSKRSNAYIVYSPSLKAFNTIKHWDVSWLVRLSDEV